MTRARFVVLGSHPGPGSDPSHARSAPGSSGASGQVDEENGYRGRRDALQILVAPPQPQGFLVLKLINSLMPKALAYYYYYLFSVLLVIFCVGRIIHPEQIDYMDKSMRKTAIPHGATRSDAVWVTLFVYYY